MSYSSNLATHFWLVSSFTCDQSMSAPFFIIGNEIQLVPNTMKNNFLFYYLYRVLDLRSDWVFPAALEEPKILGPYLDGS